MEEATFRRQNGRLPAFPTRRGTFLRILDGLLRYFYIEVARSIVNDGKLHDDEAYAVNYGELRARQRAALYAIRDKMCDGHVRAGSIIL